MYRNFRAALLMIAASLAGVGAVRAGESSSAPQGRRQILERHDQSSVEGKEIISGTAYLPPGATIGWHTHSGDETGIILEGALVMHVRGEPDRVLKAGDHYFTPRGRAHSVSAAADGKGALAFSIWVVDKGKALATPAD